MTILSDDSDDGVYNIIAFQGKTFIRSFTWLDDNGDAVNLTGGTAAMKVRKLYPATLLVAAHADAAVLSITSASEITLGGVAGTIDISVSAATMAAITPGFYDYDLEITISGEVTGLLHGEFEIRPEATY